MSFSYFPLGNGLLGKTRGIYYDPVNSHNKTTKPLIIYAATNAFGVPIRDEDHLVGCSKKVQNQCTISSDSDDFAKAGAILFHARDLINFGFFDNINLNRLRKNRKPDVPFVLWTMESPSNEQIDVDRNLINWTMSYKSNSDIVYPYSIVKKLEEKKNIDFDKIWESKTRETIWLVSNCRTKNRRMELVNKLVEKGMKIEIFGECGLEPPACPRYAKKAENCEVDLMKPYKFLIAFENSNCLEYVTEKFWKALQKRMIVPIVMSRKYYKNLGIPDSAYIAVDDFENLNEFSKFVNRVAKDKTEYLKYHKWRETHEVVIVHGVGSPGLGFCQLCERIQKNQRIVKAKTTDVNKWHSESECDNSITDQYLLN